MDSQIAGCETFPFALQLGVSRNLPDFLLDIPLHFVELAFGLVLRAWFHHFLLCPCRLFADWPQGHYATAFVSTGVCTCTNSSNRER